MSVIGPITKDDWLTMLDLRKSLKFYKEEDSVRFSKAIVKEEAILNKYYNKIKKAA